MPPPLADNNSFDACSNSAEYLDIIFKTQRLRKIHINIFRLKMSDDYTTKLLFSDGSAARCPATALSIWLHPLKLSAPLRPLPRRFVAAPLAITIHTLLL